ncbi:MAG TPA: carboxypeptidase-like regulatory domain-containing protein, partial [Pyrinomonadaceae bacterium]|nr:carboxypeptidase-like regulatory domain-containing protein [Pyrinomonadaceae bacterium]
MTRAISRIAAILILLTTTTIFAHGQRRGSITGRITPVNRGVVIVATNQVTSQQTNAETDAAGNYSLSVRPGAYRLSVESPFAARFDKTKNYGAHALVREDSLENVIVSAGQATQIDFAIEKLVPSQLVNVPARRPLGAAGGTSVESETQTQSDRREVRDRWRIGFPEYDRYGDKGARGRDIPFRRGRWFDPYHQSWLKGDYPIFGNKVFMI